MNKQKKKQYVLSDVEIHTVGLVNRGMNDETFFLMKSQDKQVEEENNLDNINEEPNMKKDESTETDVLLEQQLKQQVKKTVLDSLRELFTPKHQEDEKSPKPEEVTQEYGRRFESLEKANSELKTNLAKAQEELEQERERRAKNVLLEKARQFRALSINQIELADQLYIISKAIPESLVWLETMLKSVDNQLREANLYNEFGSSQTPESLEITEKIEKLAKAGSLSFKDALFSLPKGEQEAYAASMKIQ